MAIRGAAVQAKCTSNLSGRISVFAYAGLSVIECFETDGGVNYRSDRLIIF
jgi:hypothetical protein